MCIVDVSFGALSAGDVLLMLFFHVSVNVFVVVFFFQAEVVIRDLVRSRGLGDVYKRQVLRGKARAGRPRPARPGRGRVDEGDGARGGHPRAVSYKHLTLTTLYSV